MKRLLVFCLLLIMLAGCSNPPYDSAVGEFSFYLPEGYSIEDISDLNCAIVREDDSAVVGGIELTALKRRSLISDRDNSIILYLQDQFHKTRNVEYILQQWNESTPLITLHLRKYEDEDTQIMFSHIFFLKEDWVYHLWLKEDIAGEEAASQFLEVLK